MADYTILLRNPRTLALLGELPIFLHAKWRRHQREMGDFEITVNRNNVADSLIARNNIVEIRRDGEFEFAGIIRYREIGDPVLGGQRGDVWKLSGPDLKWWLTNRLVDPGASQYDSQVGVATETAMKHYVEDHLTAPADADRDVNTELAAGITFEVQPDASRGIDANFNGRFDNLLGGCLLPLARGADLLHDVVLLGDYSGYRYEVSEPTDATGTVTFSVGWDNVEKLIYREDYLGVRNSMYVLGQGAGAARTVEVVEDADGIAQDFRREGPIDARQADTAAKLQQIGNDRLDSLLDDSLSAHAVPAIVGPTLYRQDWDVGYDVTVSISEVGIELTRRIVEVIVQLTRNKGEDISISLGSRPKTQTRQIAEGQQRTNPVMHDGGGGAAGGYDTIEDEGVPLAQRTTIDFQGAGVTAADVGGETRVTIPGGAGAHDLLSATHTDTLPAAVVDGDLAIGNVTPAWSRLAIAIPAANVRNVLGVDNGELRSSWKAALDAVNPAAIAAAASPGTSLIFSHRDHIHAHPAALGVDLHHTELHAAAEHNAAALPASANENLGAFYLDIDDIAVPANPGATIRRLFVDTATGEISVRTSAGATVSLEGGGGGLALANKGELHGYAAADAIVAAAGADNQVLQSDAADAEGLTWRAMPRLASISDTAGAAARIKFAAASPHVEIDDDLRVERIGLASAPVAATKLSCRPTEAITATQTVMDLTPTFTAGGAGNPNLNAFQGVAGLFAKAGGIHAVTGLDFTVNPICSGVTATFASAKALKVTAQPIAIAGTGVITVTGMWGIEIAFLASRISSAPAPQIDDLYAIEVNQAWISSNATLTNYHGIEQADVPMTPGGFNRLMEMGGVIGTTPNLRLEGFAPSNPGAGLGRSQLLLTFNENGAINLRRVEHVDPGAGGVNFAGGEMVLVGV